MWPPANLCSGIGGGVKFEDLQTPLELYAHKALLRLEQIAGDGSDRKFYRALLAEGGGAQRSLVIMQGAGTLAEAASSNQRWVEVGEHLRQLGLRVPGIVEVLPQLGVVVMEDFGDRTFAEGVLSALREADREQLEGLYHQAFCQIGILLSAPQDHWPWLKAVAFDRAKFSFELSFFAQHFCHTLARLKLSRAETSWFERDCTALASFLSEQLPLAGVHRDFHSRNLMLCADGALGLIDFQDMRRGPLPYDVVSLCFDSYVPLSLAQRRRLLTQGIVTITKLRPEISVEAFADEICRAVLLQRQLKAMGSFAYLATRKGKADFLRYLKPAGETLVELYDPRWPFLSSSFIEYYLPAGIEAVSSASSSKRSH